MPSNYHRLLTHFALLYRLETHRNATAERTDRRLEIHSEITGSARRSTSKRDRDDTRISLGYHFPTKATGSALRLTSKRHGVNTWISLEYHSDITLPRKPPDPHCNRHPNDTASTLGYHSYITRISFSHESHRIRTAVDIRTTRRRHLDLTRISLGYHLLTKAGDGLVLNGMVVDEVVDNQRRPLGPTLYEGTPRYDSRQREGEN